MSKLDERDLADLTAWAESDGPVEDGFALSDEKAGRLTDRTMRMAGRPALDSRKATGEGRSPRRQVRLPRALNDELYRFARATDTTPSEVIRDALGEYLGRRGDPEKTYRSIPSGR
ncbi:CopG family transcriptional regulator [Bifidobacterium favimelis]|uniref:CopG family transcriptional regulator n=1 Tax=Bifidobacterium favimelis TaxID=3122979 RepID=A0ABU8ZL62_9BIFI